MTEKEKELLNALNIIKKFCEESSCEDCPCCCGGGCMIRKDFPDKWNLVVERPTWKAFNC